MVLLEISNLFAFIIYGVSAIGVVAFMIGFSHILGERHEARFRNEPFEAGMPVTGDARIRYSSHFYMIAMFFVIFDLDAAFIITGANLKSLGEFCQHDLRRVAEHCQDAQDRQRLGRRHDGTPGETQNLSWLCSPCG